MKWGGKTNNTKFSFDLVELNVWIGNLMKVVFDENHHKRGRNCYNLQLSMPLQSICIDQDQYEYPQHIKTSFRDMTTPREASME